MNPTNRLLYVMEYLMAAGSEPVKQIDIARDLKISPATLSRIINTLSEEGYLLRTSEKYCIPNFRLNRNVPMSEQYLALLHDLMNEITEQYKVSVEAVVVAGFDLLWHSRTQLPNPTVAIRAGVGFRRNLYELDALSRLYLSRVGWDEVSYKFFSGVFFTTGVEMKSVAPSEARRIIESAQNTNFAYDMDGNHVGVRRFATIVNDEHGNFLHLLSIAEAAVPVKDRELKISESRKILDDVRARLEAQIKKETLEGGNKKHELSPPRIG